MKCSVFFSSLLLKHSVWIIYIFLDFGCECVSTLTLSSYYSVPSSCAGTSGGQELRSQVTQEQSGSVSQALAHLPLTAVTKSSSETSAASKSDQSPASAPNPSIPESPTIKRGEYPFRRGEYNATILVQYWFGSIIFPVLSARIKYMKASKQVWTLHSWMSSDFFPLSKNVEFHVLYFSLH